MAVPLADGARGGLPAAADQGGQAGRGRGGGQAQEGDLRQEEARQGASGRGNLPSGRGNSPSREGNSPPYSDSPCEYTHTS
eukprot:380922-Prorocentrum_minimum.AAC.2